MQGERAPIYRIGLEFAPLSTSEKSAVKALVARAARLGDGKIADASPARDINRAAARLHPRREPDVRAPRILAALPTSAPATESPASKTELDYLGVMQFPPGWAITRRKSVVLARAPGDRGYLLASTTPRPQASDLCEFAQVSMQDAGLRVMHCQPSQINGLEASVGFYAGWLNPLGAVIVEAAHVVLDAQTYLIAGIASWTAYETMRNEFFTTINSFGRAQTAERGFESQGSHAGVRSEEVGCTDLRRHVRVPGPFDGVRVGLLETPIRVYDLSEGGCFISSLQDTASGQILVIRIQLPQEGRITLKAEALYGRPGFGYAVRFVEVADHVQASLNRVLHRTQERIQSQNRAGH
jgi:PilZ domain-containing protein